MNTWHKIDLVQKELMIEIKIAIKKRIDSPQARFVGFPFGPLTHITFHSTHLISVLTNFIW